jgi:4-carboxymuconolactone decarboxylase
MAESEQFERGLEIRREVLGTDYVDANLAGTDEFMMGFQGLLTEWAWGYAWSRPGLDRKTRSMLNLAILTALGRPQELGIRMRHWLEAIRSWRSGSRSTHARRCRACRCGARRDD